MRLAIFSDIHGNIFAFESIYRQIKKECCDFHLFLGDVCGYYYYGNEIIDIFKEIPNFKAIAGNHDRMFLEALEEEDKFESYTRTYGRSFEFLKDSISSENLEFLYRLPFEYVDIKRGVAAYHGSPWNPIHEYIYPDVMAERFDELPFKIVFMGHTHRPMDIKRPNIRLINPGSVGQPRDGGWPSFAIYDTVTDKLEIRRVPYNDEAMIADIDKRENNSYLVETLRRRRQ